MLVFQRNYFKHTGGREGWNTTQYNDKTTPRNATMATAPARGQYNSEQLKKMKSKRPTSAPFVSASLSVHGHLPSFATRRPNTASLIQHRVDVS